MSKISIFMFVVVIIHLLSVHGEKKEDGLCIIVTKLCVENVLQDISEAAKNIRYIANTIEDSMRNNDFNRYTLQRNINIIHKESLARSHFPTSKYYDRFLNASNIHKNDLIDLLKEQHTAVSYLYYSIKNLLGHLHIHNNAHDVSFNKIKDALQYNMLCGYRNILNIYSENWQPVDAITGIRFEESRKRDMTSLDYESYAIIILQLSRQWMKKVENFNDKLENKLI